MTIAHPECPANIREHSDFIGGTEAMIRYVAGFAEPTDFLVATEANMLWQLQAKHPRHRYHPVPGITCACNKCPHMARNTLEKLRDCMLNGEPEIDWQPEFDRAKAVLERSLLPSDSGPPGRPGPTDRRGSPVGQPVPCKGKGESVPPLVPPRFLVRIAHPCKYVKGVPRAGRGELLDLPAACRIETFAGLDGANDFADVRLAWNELGIAFRSTVTGKDQPPQGDVDSAAPFRRRDPLARHPFRPHKSSGQPLLPPIPFSGRRRRTGP